MMRNSTLKLALATVTTAIIWLVILPWMARRPAMQSHLQWLENKGVDPSAMYYTELEVMDQILERQREHQLSAAPRTGR